MIKKILEETKSDSIKNEMKMRMRKLKKTAISLVAAIGISGVLSGCIDPGRDVTVIYPVNDYVAVYGGAIATYDNNGTTQERKFDDGDVYSCEENSRVIGVGKEYRDGSKHLRLFLYLNENDFEKYEEDKTGFSGEEKGKSRSDCMG